MRIFIFIALFFTSCSSDLRRYPKPNDLIPEDKMVSVMTEVMKIEGYAQVKGYRVDQFANSMIESVDSIFKVYKVDSKSYESSLKYYGSYQDKIDRIYGEVLENINQEFGEVQSSN